MGLLKKSKTSEEPYTPPKMAELSPEYRDRVERLATLDTGRAALLKERAQLERQLEATPAPAVRPNVAKLLGDEVVDERVALRTRLGEVTRSIVDHETAIELQRRRIQEARGSAATIVLDQVKPEYAARVGALAKALEQVGQARESLAQLTDDLDADDVPWTRLGVFVPTFLGDRRDGHLQRFIREVKEAGYVD